MKNFSSKEIRFSGDSIKSCIGFIDLVDSTKNTITMDNLECIRKYYSKFINLTSEIIKNHNGKIIKNIGDCLLFYFPKTTTNNKDAFRQAIECGFSILDRRYNINQELSSENLPLFNYRITMDYGALDMALVGDYSQIDLFGSTINLCSKINSSFLSTSNDIIIVDNLYRILKSFSNILGIYNFINIGEYKISEINRLPLYNIKRKPIFELEERSQTNNKKSINNKQLDNFDNNLDKQKNKKEKIILIDDEEDILFTYKIFFENYDYDLTAFTDPNLALNYIRDLYNFDDLLIILDIRMKNLNGIQLHHQLKAIDPTIKIIFITALDIVDEFSTIVPEISKEYIMRKPVDKTILINTVKKLMK
jgi:CheY-like chemotaxis protein